MAGIVYQLKARRWFRVGQAGASLYGHIAGGPPRHSGVQRSASVRPARLHYMLNLHDPALGVESPPFQWLPLYWSADYETGFKYRIVDDEAIDIISTPSDHRPELFVPEMPESSVVLMDLSYNPSNFKDAYYFSGLFGVNHLSERIKKRVVRKLQADFAIDHTGEPPQLLDELLFDVGQTPFVQGLPHEPCPNPSCPNHAFDAFDGRSWQGIATLIVQFLPDQKLNPDLYEELAGADGGELTFQVCERCFSVCAYNPCT